MRDHGNAGQLSEWAVRRRKRRDPHRHCIYFCGSIGFQRVEFDPALAQVKEQTIRVVICEPGKLSRIAEIQPGLESLQQIVGGYIEPYYGFKEDVCIICNEEGKLNGMPLNRAIYDESDGKRGEMIDIIAGQFFLANAPYESEKFQSLTPEMIDKYNKRFRYPESFMKLGGQIMVIPEKPPARGHER